MGSNQKINIEYSGPFLREIKKLRKEQSNIKSDLKPLIESLESGSTPGDQIQGVGHTVYKVRLKNSDKRKGKSGGYRVIYYIKDKNSLTLLTIYSKLEKTNISVQEIKLMLSSS